MRVSGKWSRRLVAVARFLGIVSFPLLVLIGGDGVAAGAQLTATWVANSTAELGFSVERSVGTTGTFAEIGTTGPEITTYVDATVADATAYCYRVRAYNATGYSDYSNVACAATAPGIGLTVVNIGSGAVISTPSGIICGATCSATYASGTTVTFTATPANGFIFLGWAGGCSGVDTCTVTVTDATTVSATFVETEEVTPTPP